MYFLQKHIPSENDLFSFSNSIQTFSCNEVALLEEKPKSSISFILIIILDGAWSRPMYRPKRDKKSKSNDEFYYY